MLFADNVLRLKHKNGFGLEFNAYDALKLVDPNADLIKVSVAKEWKESRADCEFIDKMIHPFDWTFTNSYKGSLIGNKETNKEIVEVKTDQTININKLKIPEEIKFYNDICLFEDELSDHGTAFLNVKIRVMPTSFYILQRFFLRVDDVVIRVHDTRLHYETENNYILREYCEKENLIKDLKCSPKLFIEPNEIAQHLAVKYSINERLEFGDCL